MSTVPPVSSRPVAPPVVKYFESCAGSATASYTSAHGRLIRPDTVKLHVRSMFIVAC